MGKEGFERRVSLFHPSLSGIRSGKGDPIQIGEILELVLRQDDERSEDTER